MRKVNFQINRLAKHLLRIGFGEFLLPIVLFAGITFSLTLIVPTALSKALPADASMEFKPATSIRLAFIDFPSSVLSREQDGFVLLSVVVDSNGEVVDPIVIASSNPDFDQGAIETIEQYKFKPATIGDQAVSSHYVHALTYPVLGTEYEVSRVVAKALDTINSELDKPKPDFKKIDRTLNRAWKSRLLTHFAMFHISLTEFFVREKQGDLKSMMHVIERVRFFSKSLPNHVINDSEVLFNALETAFAKALLEQEKIGRILNIEREKYQRNQNVSVRLADLFKLAHQRASSTQELSYDSSIRENGNQIHWLAKHRIKIEANESNLDSIELRCARSYEKFTFQSLKEYTTNKNAAPCALVVNGNPDAAFRLIEF